MSVYTAACMCTVDLLPLVQQTSQKVFVNTEVLFWCDDTHKGIAIMTINTVVNYLILNVYNHRW